MRLLVVYQHAPTPGAPGIYRHRLLLAELVKRGWQVDLVSSPINYMQGTVPNAYRRRWFTREEIDGITHHWVAATGQVHRSFKHRAMNYATFAASASLRGMALPRPDVIWASSPPLSIGSVGHLLARRFRRPWVFEVRDLWPESAASMGMLAEDSWAYRRLAAFARTYATKSSAVIVPTPGLVDLVHGHGASNIHLITGAITDNPPDPEARTQMRAQLGVPDGACLFAYVGAHGVVNGLDRLLRAAEGLDPDQARIIMVGDGSARKALERQLSDRPNPVVQMLGTVSKDDVPNLLAASDVCLHLLAPDPLFASALPTKVLEYFGAHRPFITTVPGLPQELALASGGGFAPDEHDLAVELRRWAERSPVERETAGEHSFQFGIDRYGLTPIVDRLEDLLRGVAHPT